MKNQIRKTAFIASVLFASFALVSCNDDEPQAQGTPEEINELELTFSGTGLTTVTAKATDADGDGLGFVFDPTTIELKAGETYTLDLTFTNLLESEDVTTEIKEEADEHQIFFTATSTVVTVTYDDQESDYVGDGCTGCAGSTRNVGLKNSVLVNATVGTTGTMKIQLKHQPDGIKTDSSTAADGEDDIDLTFSVKTI